jgi:hypothetical protein
MSNDTARIFSEAIANLKSFFIFRRANDKPSWLLDYEMDFSGVSFFVYRSHYALVL